MATRARSHGRRRTAVVEYRTNSLPSLIASRLGVTELVKGLAKREQEVATIVCLRGQASAQEVVEALPDRLTNSAVRSMLTRLVAKGVLRRRGDGRRYVYMPGSCTFSMQEQALTQLAEDYFDNSLGRAALVLLEVIRRHQPAELPGIFEAIACEGPARLSPDFFRHRFPLT